LDINVHDTYFVIAHFHLVMGISALYGLFAGVYHWFPKMFGRMMNKNLGYVHFWITAVGAYGIFFPMHFIGMAGLPRRYYKFTEFPYFDDLADTNILFPYSHSSQQEPNYFLSTILFTQFSTGRKQSKIHGSPIP